MENRVVDLRGKKQGFRNGAILAALLTCMSLSAADVNTSVSKTDTTRTDTSTTTSTGTASRTDSNFIKEAVKGGQTEVKLGQLAADKSQNAEIKRFGERLVKDHSAANDELTRIAQIKGVDLAKDMDRAGTAATKDVDKFSNKTGADFDKAYIKHMVSDHKKDISKFEKESTQSNDPDLKAFAQKTLPTLREHLRMAEDIARSLGVDTASYSTSSDTSAAGAGATTSTERETSRPGTGADIKAGTDKSSQGSLKSDENTHSASASVDTTTDKSASGSSGAYVDTGKSSIYSSSDKDATVSAETKPKTKWFSTDKNDGKLWGIFPAPHHKNRETGANMSVESSGQSAAGSAPSSSSGSSSDNTQK